MFHTATAHAHAHAAPPAAPIADDDGDVLMMQQYDSQDEHMDDEDDDSECNSPPLRHLSNHHNAIHVKRNGASMAMNMGMPASRGSADSLASTASSSSAHREPELSQSFGSTQSNDLMTPVKPYKPLVPTAGTIAMRRDPTESTISKPAQYPQSPAIASFDINSRLAADLPLGRHAAQSQRSPNSSSSDCTVSATATPPTVTSPGLDATLSARRAPPPGLAGRLKINLPGSGMMHQPGSEAPTTPGGHIAVGARDGAAYGAMPMSPFEPPTPLTAPQDSPFAMASAASSSAAALTSIQLASINRPKLAQRHSSSRQTPLAMSPLAKELSSLGMRKTLSSKGSDASTTSTGSHRSECSSSSTSTLLTPPYSPFIQHKALPGDLDAGLAAPTQRSLSGGSASSVGSINSNTPLAGTASIGKSPRTVSPRPKQVAKGSKVAPYPSPRDEQPAGVNNSNNLGKPSAVSMCMTKSQPMSSHYFGTPAAASAGRPVQRAAPSMTAIEPSLPRDVVKPVNAATAMASKSIKMEKSLSEPVPRTVSARHLANRQLHPVFARNYTLGDELGSGGFGFVVSATRMSDGLPVAVKFIWKDKVPSHGWVRDDKFGAIPMEAFVLKVIDSPFVVKFVDLFADSEFFYLVMEHHGTPWKAPQVDDEPVDKMAPALAATKPEASKAMHLSPININASLPDEHAGGAPAPSPTFAVFPPGSNVPQPDDILSTSPTAMSDAVSETSTSSLTSLRPAPMERRSSCDLFECIEQYSHFSEERARWVFAQIVEAVYDLDKRGICHRDIKDENCVVDHDFNVKLIDFGSAVITDPRKPTPYFNRFFGTMTFASSEILQGKQYRAPQAEVWSLGVLLSILLTGECPFADPHAAIRGKISKPSKPWSAEATDLLLACLTVDPDNRASIREVREHRWVAKAWEQNGRVRPGSQPRVA